MLVLVAINTVLLVFCLIWLGRIEKDSVKSVELHAELRQLWDNFRQVRNDTNEELSNLNRRMDGNTLR